MNFIYSCCQDGYSNLCRECDRVFHKASIKRNHIRLPILSSLSSNDSIMSLLDDDMKAIIADYDSQLILDDGSTLDSSNCNDKFNDIVISHCICLVLCTLRSVIDDRRVSHIFLVCLVYIFLI
jgi:hypothetical protein